MSKFKVGDKVHVEFDAVVTGDLDFTKGRLCAWPVRQISGEPYDHATHYVYLSASNATLIETDPAYWPPQSGDIWEANGAEYFVIAGFLADLVVTAVDNFDGFSGEDIESNFKALNPQLVRRRGLGLVDRVADDISDHCNRAA